MAENDGIGYFIVVTMCLKYQKKIVRMSDSPEIILCSTTFPSESPKTLNIAIKIEIK